MINSKISRLCDEINDYIEMNQDNIDIKQLDIYQIRINTYLNESRIKIQKYIDTVLMPLHELDECNRDYIKSIKLANDNNLKK